jgi:hypothetical protein
MKALYLRSVFSFRILPAGAIICLFVLLFRIQRGNRRAGPGVSSSGFLCRPIYSGGAFLVHRRTARRLGAHPGPVYEPDRRNGRRVQVG